MLDRLISGAGAVTDAADRLVRALGRGGGEGLLGHRPGSVAVAAICLVLAGILVFAGLEATDNPTALEMTPDQIAQADDLGSRTYATISGSIAATYVETYTDENSNSQQDEGETGSSWYYFLIDPATQSGVTIRSQTSPKDLFTFEAAGIVLEDSSYIAEDLDFFSEEATSLSFRLDPAKYLDATAPVGDSAPVTNLADGIPAAETPMRIAGSRAGGYLETCSNDANGDGVCQPEEVNLWDVAVYDPVSGAGIVVLVDENPEYTPATFTGMLRRDERDVSDAKTTEGFDFSTLGLDVSDIYLLDDGSAPTSAPLAFGIAAALGLLAGVILIGLAGGYLVYRKSTAALPEPATTMAIGERVPVRVTGVLRAGSGLLHVREAEADLVRFQTSGPVAADPAAPLDPGATTAEPAPEAETGSADVAAPVTEPAPVETFEPVPPAPATDGENTAVTSTLIIERRGKPEGVAIGLGELVRLSRGQVMPFRGRRPAIRATAGTGPLLLSFDSEADRDRATAELLDETGLTPGETGSAHA